MSRPIEWNIGPTIYVLSGNTKQIIIRSTAYDFAIITNQTDGSVVTVLRGKKIEIVKNHLGDNGITVSLMNFILNEFVNNVEAMVNWLGSVKPEEFELHRLTFSLTATDDLSRMVTGMTIQRYP